MTHLPVEAACKAALTDGEFRIASRFWTASVRFTCGDEVHLMEIRNGEPHSVADDAAVTPSLTIDATPEIWDKMLEPFPPPFYHDIFAAATKHGVTLLPTSMDAVTAYQPAVRRFIELLRNARATNGKV